MRPCRADGHSHLAVVGASDAGDSFGRTIYKEWRDHGYDVAAVNPRADTVDGDPAYPDLASVPGDLDGVVVVVNREAAADVVRSCAEIVIPSVTDRRLGYAGTSTYHGAPSTVEGDTGSTGVRHTVNDGDEEGSNVNETIRSETATATTDRAAAGDRFGRVLDTLIAGLADQVLASQDRCVDALLDLYNVAPCPLARQLVADILGDIRHLRAVKAEWLLAELADVGAAVAVEEAFFA